ncbi:MAG: single-stranded DNA-binding protein [Dechloromonas sp.]|nr:single-stranded DNA-binding protein [Dechloromonas sp.]
MIHALITGKLLTDPVQRTSKNGNPFVTLTIAAPTGGEADTTASVICFAEATCQQLLALSKGDAVSLVGKITPKIYVDRNNESRASLDVVAELALSVYALKQKRDKAALPKLDAQIPEASGQYRAAAMAQRVHDDLSDDLPWK